MAISRIAGQMLQTNLERDGVNLSFSNLDLGNSTPVLYLDVGNNRVGINNDSPVYTLDVTGNINANANITGANLSVIGNVTSNNVNTTAVYSVGQLGVYTAANGNILLTPDGTGFSKAIGTNGFVVPVGNTAQRPGIPDTGTLRFNNTTLQLEVYDGTNWDPASNAGTVITNQQIDPDGITNTFTLNQSTTSTAIIVSINGTLQAPDVSYTVAGDQITFAEIPLITDVIQVRFIAMVTAISELSSADGNTSVSITNLPNIRFEVNGLVLANLTSSNIFDVSTSQSVKLPSYTVAQAANIANVSAGQVIYCADGDTGNPCLAVYSAGAWKRVSFGANIST